MKLYFVLKQWIPPRTLRRRSPRNLKRGPKQGQRGPETQKRLPVPLRLLHSQNNLPRLLRPPNRRRNKTATVPHRAPPSTKRSFLQQLQLSRLNCSRRQVRPPPRSRLSKSSTINSPPRSPGGNTAQSQSANWNVAPKH